MHWLIALIALTGTLANIRKKRWCFFCWLVSNSCWAAIDFRAGLPAQGWLFVTYACLAVVGWMQWGKNN